MPWEGTLPWRSHDSRIAVHTFVMNIVYVYRLLQSKFAVDTKEDIEWTYPVCEGFFLTYSLNVSSLPTSIIVLNRKKVKK